MHILITDILRCPRCGPEFGLVLLADRIEERRVLEGRLGCANCREAYPVRGGELELRIPGEERLPAAPERGGEGERALRLAALLGLAEGGGSVLLVGGGAELAEEVAALAPEVEVVTLSGAPAGGPERSGVSRIVSGAALPFAPGGFRGVAWAGPAGPGALDEGARVLGAPGRIVLEEASADAAGRLAGHGLRVLLEEEGVLVAERPGRG